MRKFTVVLLVLLSVVMAGCRPPKTDIQDYAKDQLMQMVDDEGNRKFPRSQVEWLDEGEIYAEHGNYYLILFTLDRGEGKEQIMVFSEYGGEFVSWIQHKPDATDSEWKKLIVMLAEYVEKVKGEEE